MYCIIEYWFLTNVRFIISSDKRVFNLTINEMVFFLRENNVNYMSRLFILDFFEMCHIALFHFLKCVIAFLDERIIHNNSPSRCILYKILFF